MKKEISQITNSIFKEIVNIRRHLHQFPELSFEEYETSKFIQSKLDLWGIEYSNKWIETGVVAIIKGKKPKSKCIGLRADIDALPILEENNVTYKSKHNNVMHACGHDVHSSILLGVAYTLNKLKNSFEGTIKLIFQPGEEKLPGGAHLMIEAGVLENPKVDKILALHVFPELEVGKVGFKEGVYMASCDEIHANVIGIGGHGAMPHKVIDPILISAHLLTSLQQIISRNCSPTIPSVLSFGKIEGLGATNIIPSKVLLKGTFRTLNEEWRKKAHILIQEHSKKLVEAMGGTIDLQIIKGYPYLENNKTLTLEAKKIAVDILSKKNVIELPIRMTGEDFSFFSQKIPACFFRLGVRNKKKGIVNGVHHPKFNVDEQSINIGINLLTNLAIKI